MRSLLGTTALGAIAAVTIAVPASAETVISTAVTTPQSTSASGDLKISSTGSVKPASGAAVTLNTNNYVRNEGTIQITGANDSTGILGNSGVTGEITNSGTITLDENYTPTDTDSDGDGTRECHGCSTGAPDGYPMEMEFITYAEYGEPLEIGRAHV